MFPRARTFRETRIALQRSLAALEDGDADKAKVAAAASLDELYAAILEWELDARFVLARAAGRAGWLVKTPNAAYTGAGPYGVTFDNGRAWVPSERLANELCDDFGYDLIFVDDEAMRGAAAQVAGVEPPEFEEPLPSAASALVGIGHIGGRP